MHPEIVTDREGSCPICGMDLVPLDDEGAGHPDHGRDGHGEPMWSCPEHPEMIREPGPGVCPIDGLDLVEEVPAAPMVSLEPSVIQNMNVSTAPVKRHDLVQTHRTVGVLDYDMTRMVTVTTRISGFVENLRIATTGEVVERGQPLFDVFAPDLVQTQHELLSAVDYVHRLRAAGASEDTVARAEALVSAAKQRLSLWDISSDQIEDVLTTGEVRRVLTIHAPSRGVVMRLMHGLEGMKVQPGMELIHIAGMDPLWLTVELPEALIGRIALGDEAVVRFEAFPNVAISGRVRWLAPEITDATRSLPMAIAVANPAGRLRVGMYATVDFEVATRDDVIAVPRQAVLRTGTRTVVVVASGDGRFEPREVQLGLSGDDDMVGVVTGLEVGERIVLSGQFLIDSESNLKAALARMRSAVGSQ